MKLEWPRWLDEKLLMGTLLVGLAGTLVADSASGAASVHGSICQAVGQNTNGYSVFQFGVSNTNPNNNINIVCPTPVDHDVGGSLQWEARVQDGSSQSTTVCRGAALANDGNLIGLSSQVESGLAFTGGTTLAFSVSAAAGSATNTYVVLCSLGKRGGLDSEINGLRIF